jgi:hypothetical protein
MVCKGNGVNESLSPIEGGAVDVDVSDSLFPPNNFGTGPIAVVLLGCGVEAGGFCGSAGGSAVGLGGGRTSAFGSGGFCGAAGLGGSAGLGAAAGLGCSAGSATGAEFNLFFLPQIAGT